MMAKRARQRATRSVQASTRWVGRRRLLIGAGTLSLSTLLASAADTAPVVAEPQGNLPLGRWSGDVLVSRVSDWREPEPGPAAGAQGDASAQVTSVLRLSGNLSLTVAEAAPGADPMVTGMLTATWSLRSVRQLSDGRRTEEERSGRLTGGQVVAETDALTGEPRLIVRGATWQPGAFPSFTVWGFGADGTPSPVGDGMVEARAADPVVMVVESSTPDLVLGGVAAADLRPPGPPFGGGIADPSAQAIDLRVMTAGGITLLRTARR